MGGIALFHRVLKILGGAKPLTHQLSDMERLHRKADAHGGRVNFERLGADHGPKFVATDLRSGTKRYATRVRYAKNYAVGLSERGALLAESYGLEAKDIDDIVGAGIVLDCGAHYGDLCLWIRETLGRDDVRYVGFEPDSEARACLTLNAQGTMDTILPYALSDSISVRDFHLEPSGANSSLEEPALPSSPVSVVTRDLDSVVSELGMRGQPIGLLKLEAEGHEPEVLFGAAQTLSDIGLIAADLGPERGPNADVTAPAVINHLLASGFRIRSAGADRASLRFTFENTQLRGT